MFPQFFLHGRYGPEGPLQLYVQGGWLLCTSRCIPFPDWQAPLFGLPCCLRCTGILDFGRWRLFFSGPLYLEATCSSCLPEEYRFAYFRVMTSGCFPYSALFLVQQRIRVRHQSRGFMEEIHAFLREGRTLDPVVDPRPHDCSKLWSLRSCSPSLSSTSLSWRIGRFPWSLSFSSCSTLTG